MGGVANADGCGVLRQWQLRHQRFGKHHRQAILRRVDKGLRVREAKAAFMVLHCPRRAVTRAYRRDQPLLHDRRPSIARWARHRASALHGPLAGEN